MLFLNIVKSEYSQVLFLLLSHYHEFSGSLAYLFCKFKMLTIMELKLISCFCHMLVVFSCSPPVAHYSYFSSMKKSVIRHVS